MSPMPDELDCQARELLGERALRLQVRLDLLDVLMQWRPAARILLPREGPAETAARVCLAVSLVPVVDPVMVWQPRATPTSPYVDHIGRPNGTHSAEPLVALFVARTPLKAQIAMQADHSANDERLGVALGYPPCCVEFVKRRTRVPTLVEALSMYSQDGAFDPIIWPPAALNDAGLLPHFPCGITCASSRKLAIQRLNLISKHCPAEDRDRIWMTAQAAFGQDALGLITMRATGQSLPKGFGWLKARVPLPSPQAAHD